MVIAGLPGDLERQLGAGDELLPQANLTQEAHVSDVVRECGRVVGGRGDAWSFLELLSLLIQAAARAVEAEAIPVREEEEEPLALEPNTPLLCPGPLLAGVANQEAQAAGLFDVVGRGQERGSSWNHHNREETRARELVSRD